MDVVERLTLEAAQEDTMLACEHRHRYEFAASLCAGQRVLDLCCGSGYGTATLAATAREVTGIDNDAATIETAAMTVGKTLPKARFELADAIALLGSDTLDGYDSLVCFEGLEHLEDLERGLVLMQRRALNGLRIVASMPNGKLFEERNPFHATTFGYDDAMRAFAGFPSTMMIPQFLAEGSLICPPDALESDVSVNADEHNEPEYANHFLFCVNFEPAQVSRALDGRMQLRVAPVFNRWSEDLKRGAASLRRENARLARARLGKQGSAAAAAVARLAHSDEQIADLRHRCMLAEERVTELESMLLEVRGDVRSSNGASREAVALDEDAATLVDRQPAVISGLPEPLRPGEDPNSWDQRRRRAGAHLIPWIEQTVPLSGLTVLEYGCGNAAVTSAFAQRAGQVIGVDIDPDQIALAETEVARMGLDNVTLEQHPVDSILEAVAARRGTVDVFLLYAVLEHLTVEERLDVLTLARDVVKPEGAIVVCETPNRLIYFDHHTAQMPFFHLIPDELALAYYERSGRPQFTAAMQAAQAAGPEAGLEAIARWGRGVSFHEFEVVFGDLTRHVIASNYDPLLFPERPIHPDEVILSRYLDRWRPDLAPVWSRYWLDLILSPQPRSRREPFVRPWSADTSASYRVGWTRWENLHLAGPDATLSVDLPSATDRLVVGVVPAVPGRLRVSLRPQTMHAPLSATIDAPPGQTWFIDCVLEQPSSRIELRASAECHVVFVGHHS